MTTRRRARAARGGLAVLVVEGVPVLPELLDAEHPLWHDQDRYREFMTARGWRMPAAERFGVSASPPHRRAMAAVGWARAHGLADNYHQLRAWGLV